MLSFPLPPWDAPGLDVFAVLTTVPPGSRVADCGCYGWPLAAACHAARHQLIGFDRSEPAGRPAAAAFERMSGTRLHVGDDSADVVVANHVLEHMTEPSELFGELARVAAPGGLLWVESPSELSAIQPGSDTPDDHAFKSFWDDPTHVRPWTPGALYRLALSWSCVPLFCGRAISGDIHVSRLLAQKPQGLSGRPPHAFVSLKDVPPGLAAAWAHVWPSEPSSKRR